MKAKSQETLTPAQSAQQALDIERERYSSSACWKEPDGLESQGPTPDAVSVLRNAERRHKANYYRSRRACSR
jgi:hypothetical protein